LACRIADHLATNLDIVGIQVAREGRYVVNDASGSSRYFHTDYVEILTSKLPRQVKLLHLLLTLRNILIVDKIL
jgi:hypothetical protein